MMTFRSSLIIPYDDRQRLQFTVLERMLRVSIVQLQLRISSDLSFIEFNFQHCPATLTHMMFELENWIPRICCSFSLLNVFSLSLSLLMTRN